jgi:hypothetical protein
MAKIAKYSIYAFLIAFVVISCNEIEETNVYNADLLFPNAFEIPIDDYIYSDPTNGKDYVIKCDSVADTVGPMPEFRWLVNTRNLVTVAVSKVAFIVLDNNIVNSDSIIWKWHKGLKEQFVESKENKYLIVPFLEGRNVENKNILYSTQPLALESGLYFWAVWGWDVSGKNVIFSSKMGRFVVE